VRRRPTPLLAAVLGATVLAGCTSSTEGTSPGSTSTGSTSTGSTAAGAGDLAVTGTQDLSVPAPAVTGARVVPTRQGAVVLLTGPTSTVVTTTGSATGSAAGSAAEAAEVADLAASDVVLVDDDPVAAGLTAEPVGGDPVLALGAPGDDPVPLDPQRAARRGTPVLAAAGDDVVRLLVEDAEDLAAAVLAVDPATGEVQDGVDLDLGDDVTALDLVGLAATGDGLVAGLDVRTADGGSTGRLVALDDDLRQTGDPEVLDEPLLALTTAGDPVTASDLGAGADGARVAGAATTGGAVVVAVLDRSSPTVLVGGGAGDPTALALCDGEGDALAVAAADDAVLVAGTCDGYARLWTLG